ncbi:MAG: hypothetical protein IIA23_12130 [Chloroflexi bacterium]|nr:hypothetical protein [Chloroflexota bacterium]
MQDDAQETIRRLAALAGVPLTQERLDALALTLPFVQTGMAALADIDYRAVEPAARFRPRPEAPR